MSKKMKKDRDETLNEIKNIDLKVYDPEDAKVRNKVIENTDKI